MQNEYFLNAESRRKLSYDSLPFSYAVTQHDEFIDSRGVKRP